MDRAISRRGFVIGVAVAVGVRSSHLACSRRARPRPKRPGPTRAIHQSSLECAEVTPGIRDATAPGMYHTGVHHRAARKQL